MPQRTYISEVDIAAPPAEVWAVLADIDNYRSWNPFTVEVRSSLEIGEPVDMRVVMQKLGGITISQRETLRAFDVNERIVWGMTMLGGAIRAERRQTLEPLAGGATRYRTEDTIEGPLGPVVYTFFGGSIQAGFDALADALKVRVEQG